jgi:thioredoxin-like negative regulator of GroEL
VRPETDLRLAAHLEGCPECLAERRKILRAAVMLHALPYEQPDEDAREQARTRLMAALSVRPPRPASGRSWLKAGVIAGASLCGSIVLAAVGTHVLQPRLETPQAAPPAEVAPRKPRPVRRAVEPPPPVAAPVPVEQPVPVVKRPPARPAPRRLAEVSVTPPPLVTPPPARPEAGPAERAFNQGWEALRAGDRLGAAAQMRRALDLEPGNALAEDARYWRAVALGRAGVTGEARDAMEDFLRSHPASNRAGEVSVMLGWLLIDAGERPHAEALFRAAAADARPEVRKSAQAGLGRAVAPPQFREGDPASPTASP